MEKLYLKATKDKVIHLVGSDQYYEEVIDWESCDYNWELVSREEVSKEYIIQPFIDCTI